MNDFFLRIIKKNNYFGYFCNLFIIIGVLKLLCAIRVDITLMIMLELKKVLFRIYKFK